MYINAVTTSFSLLFCRHNASDFDTEKKENVKLMSALHGNTRLLGLRDNQFTWQHRAKNIWTALKITGEKEKRGGALPSQTHTHLSLQASRWCYSADAGSKVCVRGGKIISESVCLRARQIHRGKHGKVTGQKTKGRSEGSRLGSR